MHPHTNQSSSRERDESKPEGRSTPPASDNGGSKAPQASKRFIFTSWRGEGDHELCTHALVTPPESAPYLGRTGLATAKWVVVDKSDDRELICNRLHEGPCEWPYEVGSA